MAHFLPPELVRQVNKLEWPYGEKTLSYTEEGKDSHAEKGGYSLAKVGVGVIAQIFEPDSSANPRKQ